MSFESALMVSGSLNDVDEFGRWYCFQIEYATAAAALRGSGASTAIHLKRIKAQHETDCSSY